MPECVVLTRHTTAYQNLIRQQVWEWSYSCKTNSGKKYLIHNISFYWII